MIYKDTTTGQYVYVPDDYAMDMAMNQSPLVYQNRQQQSTNNMPSMMNMMRAYNSLGAGSMSSPQNMKAMASMYDFADAAPSGGSSSWMSSAGAYAPMAGYIAAAIAAQHMMSSDTKTKFEGVSTDDAFGGLTSGDITKSHFMTEPWLGFAYDKIGFNASPGQRFDAAWENQDYKKMAKRLPAAAGYWANPGASVTGDVIENTLGKTGKYVLPIIDPIQGSMRLIEDLF